MAIVGDGCTRGVREYPVAPCPTDRDISRWPLTRPLDGRIALLPHMRQLFATGLFWTSVACCLVAQGLIIRSVRGARHVPVPSAGVPRHRGAIELLWAVVPALGLVLLLAFTWRAIQRAEQSHAVPSHDQSVIPA